MDRANLRWIGIVGLVAIVLILVGAFTAGEPPAIDDPVGEIRDYLVDERDAFVVGGFLQLLTFPLVAWFIVGLRRVLAGGDDGPWPTVVMISTFVLGGLVLAATAAQGGLLYEEGFVETASDDVVKVVWTTTNLLYAVGAAAFTVILGGFGLSTLRGKVFPVWLGWLSVVLGVLGLVGTLSVLDPDMFNLAFISFMGFSLWLLITSIVLMTMGGRPAGAPASAAPPG